MNATALHIAHHKNMFHKIALLLNMLCTPCPDSPNHTSLSCGMATGVAARSIVRWPEVRASSCTALASFSVLLCACP